MTTPSVVTFLTFVEPTGVFDEPFGLFPLDQLHVYQIIKFERIDIELNPKS